MTSWTTASTSRRSFLKISVTAGGALLLGGGLSACGGGDGEAESDSGAKIGASLDEIASLAKQEGHVQLIAYPETWANYKGHFKEFTAKYGVKIEVANPDGSSAQELQAVKTLKGQKTQPDVLDIGYSFTKPAIQGGLLEKYKPSNFDTVPDALKDPEGWWVGAYYGVLTIGVNPKAVDNIPQTFADLLKPEYKGKVMMPGDPRQGASSNATVVAAALSRGGGPGNIGAGIDYFAELKKSGNLVTATSVASALTTGEAAIAFDWNYNFVGIAGELAKSKVKLEQVVPSDGVSGVYYAQPLTVASPQPNAGRLWIDWLTSDEGSEQYALGGAVPARIAEVKDKLSKEALDTLPDPAVLEKVVFPTIEQGEAGAKLLVEQWGPKVLNQ